jgi:hypothetical protein
VQAYFNRLLAAATQIYSCAILPPEPKVMETTLVVLSVLGFIYISIRYGIALLIWWGKRT